MCSVGWRVQAVRPASASDAPISLRKLRRPSPGIFIVAPADGLAREFALQQVLELRRRRQLVQAAPVFAAAGCLPARSRARSIAVRVRLLSWVSLIGGKCEQLVSSRASLNVVFLLQLAADLFLIARRLITHGGDELARPDVLLRDCGDS